MTPEERTRIIRGLVRHDKDWVPIEQREKSHNEWRKKIEDGYVFFMNEWMTIDQKMNTLNPRPQEPKKEAPQSVVINKTINRQVYNVEHRHINDQRTFHETRHEHKHVHIDGEALADAAMRQGAIGGKGDSFYELADDGTKLQGIEGKRAPEGIEGRKPLQIDDGKGAVDDIEIDEV